MNLQFVRVCLQYITFVPEAQLKVWEAWIDSETEDEDVRASGCLRLTLAWLTKKWREAQVDWEEVLGSTRKVSNLS